MTLFLIYAVALGIVVLAVLVVVQKRAQLADHRAAANRDSEVEANSEVIQQRIVAAIGAFGKYKTESPVPGTIVAVQPRYPDWTIIVSILFFPIGLLALLARTEDRGTIQITSLDDRRSRVQLGGRFRPRLLESIGELLDSEPLG